MTLGADTNTRTDLETAVADRDFVDVVFKQLTKREREALWQSAVESRPVADIATRLQLSYMAAAQVLHRARQHAVKAAGRVAVVFGIFRLGRQRSGAGLLLSAQRLAAAAAVPLIVVSMNASSPKPQPTPATPSVLSVPAASAVSSVPHTGVGDLSGSLPGLTPNPDSLLPGSAGTLNAATGRIEELVKQLRSVIASPSALPSLPALPSPSLPGVP